MRDTTDASQDRYRELLRALTPEQRMAAVLRLNQAVRELARAGIADAYPDATPREHDALLAERLYGSEVARQLYGCTHPDER